MSMRLGKEQRTVKRLRSMTLALLLMQLATASAEPFVPGAWVQRAAERQGDYADKQVVDHFSSVEVIGTDELGEMRGGLSIAGLDIDVGAVVRTIIDGTLALESHISLATANEIAAAINADTGSAVNAALPSGSGGGTETVATANAGNSNGAARPADNVTIQSSSSAVNLANPASVVINDAKGLTQVIHDVTRDRVVAAIVNQADRREIRQQVDIDITVSNFREFQRAAAQQRVSRVLDRVGR